MRSFSSDCWSHERCSLLYALPLPPRHNVPPENHNLGAVLACSLNLTDPAQLKHHVICRAQASVHSSTACLNRLRRMPELMDYTQLTTSITRTSESFALRKGTPNAWTLPKAARGSLLSCLHGSPYRVTQPLRQANGSGLMLLHLSSKAFGSPPRRADSHFGLAWIT